MNGYAQLARSVFPLAMVVVCSSVYFIFIEGRGPESTATRSERTGNPPSEAGEAIPQAIAEETQHPARLGTGGQRIETHSKSEPGEIVRASAAGSATDSRATQLATTDADLEVADVQLESPPTQDRPAAPVQSPPVQSPPVQSPSVQSPSVQSLPQTLAADPSTGDATPVRSTPIPTAAPESVVENRHYQSTRVNDYWVGLARARGDHPVDHPSNAPDVVGNPYFTESAPSTGDSRHSEVGSSRGPSQQPATNVPNRSSVVESPSIDPSELRYELPHRSPNPLPVNDWTQPPSLPLAVASPAAPPLQRSSVAATAALAHQVTVATIPPVSDHIRQKLSEHWEYGGSLARRNATRLAKQEFFSGLSLLAEHADQSRGATEHLTALREGFLALEEAADFESHSQLRQVQVQVMAQKHETPIIRAGYFTTDSHSQARTAYLLYAKSRIEFALGTQPLAGELLYSLGKLSLANHEFNSKTDNLEFMRASMLFESALVVNPEHEKSANELAVIRAKNGDWQAARQLLQRAVVLRPDFLEAWQNLAKVHQRMGEQDLAQLAGAQVEYLSQFLAEQGSVRMVSNAEFAATAAAMDGNEEMMGKQPTPQLDESSKKRSRLFPSFN